MNTYRVDRANSLAVPCGQNSIIYVGVSSRAAHAAFDAAQTGIDCWGQPNSTYGVLFSVWHPTKGDYVVKRSKGVQS